MMTVPLNLGESVSIAGKISQWLHILFDFSHEVSDTKYLIGIFLISRVF